MGKGRQSFVPLSDTAERAFQSERREFIPVTDPSHLIPECGCLCDASVVSHQHFVIPRQ